MLDKKQIQAIFLFKFKMGRKAVETTCNINNAFGQGTAKTHTVQWWFKSFAKETRALTQWLAIGSWQWPIENIIKADPLKTPQEVAKELSVDHSTVIWHLKQIAKVKKLDKWAPHELTPKSKNSLFWSVVLSYSTQQQWVISQSDCDLQWKVDCIWQLTMTSSVDWEAPKHFPKLILY